MNRVKGMKRVNLLQLLKFEVGGVNSFCGVFNLYCGIKRVFIPEGNRILPEGNRMLCNSIHTKVDDVDNVNKVNKVDKVNKVNKVDNTRGDVDNSSDNDYGVGVDTDTTVEVADQVGDPLDDPLDDVGNTDEGVYEGDAVEDTAGNGQLPDTDTETENGRDFDKLEGDVKECIVSNIIGEKEVNKDYIERGIGIINRDTESVVQIVDGGVVNETFYNVGGDSSDMVVKSEGVVVETREGVVVKSRKGIEDIVNKFYSGVKVVLGDNINLQERLTNIRRRYREIDDEIKGVNRLGFVNYHGFIKECPILVNVLASFIN